MSNLQASSVTPDRPFRAPHWADKYTAAATDDERLTIALSYLRATLKQSTANPDLKNRVRRELTNAVIHAIHTVWDNE